MSFDKLPHTPSIPVERFAPHIPDAHIADLKARLAQSAPRAQTWDNTNGPDHLGVKRGWLDEMVDKWQEFDWRDTEREIASFPSYRATVSYKGHEYKIHFLALWAADPDATPVVFSHGWPGSVLEFVPMLNYLRKTYTPATLPNHIIVPALVGYGFSSPPALDLAFSARDNAAVFDGMLAGLGFARRGDRGGYYAQGGDIGSFVTRQLSRFENCLGIHLNFFPMLPPEGADLASLDEFDQKGLARAAAWGQWGQGYRIEQSTKPATIGAVLESSPVAVLAWIGEKLNYIQLPAEDKLRFLLAEVSLYWYTGTAATCMWEYRAAYGMEKLETSKYPDHIAKPTGYSQFAFEIMPTPISFVKMVANVVSAKRHLEGGHFAALEQPVALWDDVQAYLQAAAAAKL